MTNKIGPVDQRMIGKIGNKIEESGTPARVAPEKAAGDGAAARPEASKDTVQLTDRAQLLERLEQSLKSLPSVDAERVAEIKTAIENGNYEIDAKAIADAMLRFERSLGD